MKIERKDIWLLLAQVAVWALILLVLPTATLLSTHDWKATSTSGMMVWNMLHSPLILYFVNFYVFYPYFFAKRRYKLFILCNVLMMVVLNYGFFYMRHYMPNMPAQAWIGFFTGILSFLLLNCACIVVAIGIRHAIHTRTIKQQLMAEKAKNTEAELAWLKNQINPHFLFNTLNNISSLTQIDADAAQDAIAQLSDLLRYAMYETNKQLVPLSGEVDFMRNYIDLMKLRCSERTTVNCQWSIGNDQLEIAPLLFISLIENAFKHGVSSNRPSSIDIHMEQAGQELTFCCDNTNYPKSDDDRSGSGIGLENTRRRLELMYQNRYEWEQWQKDDIYHIQIKLKL